VNILSYLILNVVVVIIIYLTSKVAIVSMLCVITEGVGGIILNTYRLSVPIQSKYADCHF
jgi:hypothetical protein